ncbi:DUF4998 domain-containing protein [Leeuwenhoekiella parthenopeia]|uniref:DUF5013 domain-containing protein n=1 Tax=Leeuwenhoekiella parthenopeia TaxID=2890320 RepID=A0ABS8GT53_9FLAO|nr:DUF4998 domain-containing protein [Leeuwenhoekiella parthenopeia]MCC4213180.1 DUF5013 domain-containing protein [Leeuwenhoekiella parthenopeia]
MKNLHLYIYVAVVSCFMILWSCSDQEYDDYKKFADGGEINYTEKVDSLKSFSGKNRIMLQGIINADPKITEFRVFWNDGRDSVSVPITRSGGVDTLEVTIADIPENIYNFQIRTYDAAGNKSLVSNVTGAVYGERYQNTLYNRPVLANDLVNGTLTISYASMDLTTGVIGTEVLIDGASESIFIPIDSEEYNISDYVAGESYKYRTLFLPEETAIDTFTTDYVSYTPIAKPILVNAAIPFKASSRSGRWGILEDWTTTQPVLVHGGYGGWDEWNGNIFNIESGWGAAAVNNGKIYQTLNEVQPATYVLNVLIRDTNHKLTDAGGSYFVVAKGNTLPDVSDVTSAEEVLAYKRINVELGSEYTYRLEFTIEDESTDITVGQITTQASGDPGRFCNVRSWDIVVQN